MTLQAAIEAHLPYLRVEAESLMQDIFTVYSPGAMTIDGGGFEVPGYASQGTTFGKIAGPSTQSRDTNARTVVVGGVERQVVEGGLHIPIDADAPAMGEYGIGWEYLLTGLGPYSDPSLMNSRWLVVDAPAKSYATARRLDVVRIA